MRVSVLATLAGLLGSVAVQACGGGGSGPNPPPPPPPAPTALAKQAGDGQTSPPGQAVPVRPSVKVTSAGGAAVSGVQVTFAVASGGGGVTGGTPTTGSDGVATVGDWTLGAAEGANTLTATIAGTGVTGNPATFSATGEIPDFSPTANTSLTGTHNFATVNIPAGVTVTATGNLVINATEAVTIAGTLVGNCVAITVSANGTLSVSGTVNNGCTGAPAALPAINLVGKGGYSFTGAAQVVAAGNVTITDDPTATDADFAPGALSELRIDRPPVWVGVPCNYAAFIGTASPATAPPTGVDGNPNGTDGGDGGTWTLRCKGGGDITVGALSLTGQHGGKGGNGTHSSATAAVSRGGKGGKGALVKIQTKGTLSVGTASIATGDGGDGGSANADGSSGHGGTVGASASATGGAGGAPGLFTATAGTSISIGGVLVIGKGGKGGNAIAIGGNGRDGSEACVPAAGGPASAIAGAGGSTPDKVLSASGAVAGGLVVTGGVPGAGGNAEATGGKGGNGAQPCKPGADGGEVTARGGDGGDAGLRGMGVSPPLIANGANGGSMKANNALGGLGWSDCVLPTFEPGGNGGKGGNTVGNNGKGGTGLAAGTGGAITYNAVSDGGNGGNGLGPGTGGNAGAKTVTVNGGVTPTTVDPSFVPGTPGQACPSFSMVVTPQGQSVTQGGNGTAHVVITRVGGFTGAVALEIKDQGGVVRGTGTIGAGNTIADVSFTAPANEPLGTRNWTVVGTGAGVPIQTELLALNLVAGGSSIAITNVTPTNPTVTAGSTTGTFGVTITRTNFTGNLSAFLQNETAATLGSASIPGPAGTSGSNNYTVPVATSTGAHTFKVVVSGNGVSTVMQDFPVTVIPPATVGADLNTMPHTGNLVPFGTHTLDLVSGATTLGTVQVQTVSVTGNHFWSNSMPAGLRVGSGNGNGFRILLNTAQVNGSAYTVAGVGYCLLNPSGVDGTFPVIINQRNAGLTVVTTESLTAIASPLCRWSTIEPTVTSIEILAPAGMGRFIDSGSWQLWRP